jgi:hypothetical protein
MACGAHDINRSRDGKAADHRLTGQAVTKNRR